MKKNKKTSETHVKKKLVKTKKTEVIVKRKEKPKKI